MEYRCERVGMFGTFSVEERVRYRGELHDPNEVSLTIAAGALSLLIAFALRTRTSFAVFWYVIGVAIAAYTIFLTKSRGGQICALLVPFVYMVRRWGIKAFIPAGMAALPVLLLGGRSGEAADMSTELRYEAWATGLDLFHHSPLFGVGARMFGSHHFLTAHNSFVLTLAEMGFVGMVLFTTIIFLCFKMLIVGLKTLATIPEAKPATVWGMSLLASMAGVLFQINTLSFAYHSLLWIFFGLVGAWWSAVRHHLPTFQVKVTTLDFAIIVAGCVGYAMFILPLFLRFKGY